MSSALDIPASIPTKAEILSAMRADSIPEGESGLWRVERWTSPDWTRDHSGNLILPGTYTTLRRYTDGSIHLGGENVMSDDVPELSRHLDFLMRPLHGRVLLTGLGLGCVLRGVLCHGAVEAVDVVERDPDVLKLVAEHLPGDPRVTIHQADALEFIEDTDLEWEFAWHDVWNDRDAGEPHLAITHQRLMLKARRRAGWQGAWNFPRWIRRTLRERFAI